MEVLPSPAIVPAGFPALSVRPTSTNASQALALTVVPARMLRVASCALALLATLARNVKPKLTSALPTLVETAVLVRICSTASLALALLVSPEHTARLILMSAPLHHV
jgi:hypothetical protein